jgi:hypothetical protein
MLIYIYIYIYININEMLVEKFNHCTLQLMRFKGEPSIVPLCTLEALRDMFVKYSFT